LPAKFILSINLKTAKALGLEVSWFLQQRADDFVAVHESGFGTKRTSRHVRYLSASLIGRLGQALSD
jgi:hypothetical protein